MNVENLQTGYVRIYRSIERNPVWSQHPPEYLKVWIACLLRANYKPSRWYTNKGEIEVPRGAFVCSAEKLALNLNVNCSTLRRALKALQVQQMIDVKATNSWTMITVCNYDGYNSAKTDTDGRATDERRTGDGPPTDARRTPDGRATTSKESNNSNSGNQGKQVSVDEPPAPTITVASGHGWEDFIGVYLAAGKKLNEQDLADGLREWLSLELPDQLAAFRHLQSEAIGNEERYLKFPGNFLRKRPWTRVGPERVLPMQKRTRVDDAQAEALRIFEAQQNGGNN